MIQYEVFTAGYANTKLLEKDAKNKWRSRGTLKARSTRSATVKETRQSWNGLLLRRMWEDDQLQVEWEKGISSTR